MSTKKIVKKRLSIQPNQKFGYWTVISYSDRGGRGEYKCKCKCGNIKYVKTESLKKGYSKSCGCRFKELGEQRRMPNNRSLKNLLLKNYKNSAYRRNHIFNLSFSEFENLIENNCYYCNSSKEESTNIITDSNRERKYIYNGIDRIDNSKGYIKDNVVSCCPKCNMAKRLMTLSEFQQWINKIYNNFKERSTTIPDMEVDSSESK
jgi:hypothetical protein